MDFTADKIRLPDNHRLSIDAIPFQRRDKGTVVPFTWGRYSSPEGISEVVTNLTTGDTMLGEKRCSRSSFTFLMNIQRLGVVFLSSTLDDYNCPGIELRAEYNDEGRMLRLRQAWVVLRSIISDKELGLVIRQDLENPPYRELGLVVRRDLDRNPYERFVNLYPEGDEAGSRIGEFVKDPVKGITNYMLNNLESTRLAGLATYRRLGIPAMISRVDGRNVREALFMETAIYPFAGFLNVEAYDLMSDIK